MKEYFKRFICEEGDHTDLKRDHLSAGMCNKFSQLLVCQCPRNYAGTANKAELEFNVDKIIATLFQSNDQYWKCNRFKVKKLVMYFNGIFYAMYQII